MTSVKELRKVFGDNFIDSAIEHGIDISDPFRLYELKASTEDMTDEREDEFLKVTARRMQPGETKMGKYAFLDFFANPHFREEFKTEMFDIIRRREGPVLKTGLVACRKCKSEKTVSNEVFTRSADEASRMAHSCQDCKHFWTT